MSSEKLYYKKYLKYKQKYTILQSYQKGGSPGSRRARIHDSSQLDKPNILFTEPSDIDEQLEIKDQDLINSLDEIIEDIKSIIFKIKNPLDIIVNNKSEYDKYEAVYSEIIFLIKKLKTIYDNLNKEIQENHKKKIIEYFMILLSYSNILFKKLIKVNNINCHIPFFFDQLLEIVLFSKKYTNIPQNILLLLSYYVWIKQYIKQLDDIISIVESNTQIVSLRNFYIGRTVRTELIYETKKKLIEIRNNIYTQINDYYTMHKINKEGPFYDDYNKLYSPENPNLSEID